MMTFTPMIACGGGLYLPPWLMTIIGITFALWFVAAAVAIPNVIMSSRAGQSAASKWGNFGFFMCYAGLSLVLWTGLVARMEPEAIGLGTMVILFFFGPGMVIGHFCYLLVVRARERRARNSCDLSDAGGLTGPGS